jgi:hypothetical protein
MSWSIVKHPKWGWSYLLVEHGRSGRRFAGWRPTKSMCRKAMERMDAKLDRRVQRVA